MTSLSSMSAASMTSPGDRMKLRLQSMVSAGSVKSADQGALASALDDIGAAMKAGGAPAAGTDPGTMKTKVDSLVDQEVSDGKLTTDQATELKQVFAKAAHGLHGAHGAGGPPPPPPSDDDDTTATSSTTGAPSSTTGTTSASTTDSTKSAIETLIAFLKQLEQATSSSTNYTANGSTGSIANSAVLVNATA